MKIKGYIIKRQISLIPNVCFSCYGINNFGLSFGFLIFYVIFSREKSFDWY